MNVSPRAAFVSVSATGACAGVLAALAGAVASPDRLLSFSTVEHASTPERAPVPGMFSFAAVADRISEDPLDRAGRENPVDYRTFATVYVTVDKPTSGYSVTIRRVTLQRHGPVDQVCARVAITPPRPDHIVTQVKTRYWHFVEIPRTSFGRAVPNTIVARTTAGRLIYTLPAARTSLCR